MPILCKFCGVQKPTFDDLRAHCRADHRATHVAIQKFLGDVDEKDLSVTRVAAEGMDGKTEEIDIPKLKRRHKKEIVNA